MIFICIILGFIIIGVISVITKKLIEGYHNKKFIREVRIWLDEYIQELKERENDI